MNKSTQAINDEMLQQYVDGELKASEYQRVSAYLQSHPEAQQRVLEYRQINQMLVGLNADQLDKQDEQASVYALEPRSKAWRMAASVAWLTVGALIGWFGHIQANVGQTSLNAKHLVTQLARPAQLTYAVYSPEKLHSVEVGADEVQHLVKWLTKRMGGQVNVPDLNDSGYHLLGGRLLADQGGPACMLMYENDAGQRLALNLKQVKSAAETTFTLDEADDIRTFYWVDNGFGYALTGPDDKPAMLAMAQTVSSQLNL